MNPGSVKLCKNALISLFFIFSNTIQASPVNTEQPSEQKQQQNHQEIIQSARQFLDDNINHTQYSRVDIQMGKLDSRLSLANCNKPLTTSLAQGSQFAGKTTVHIRCSGETPWTVYLSAHINLFSNVVQTATPLSKGHILKESDLTLAEMDLSRLKYGFFTDASHLIGKQLKRGLPQKRVIKANYVKSPTLVKRGELVSIVAENTGYSVKMTGTAMMSGARGDRIRVKNLSSNRIIEGKIKETGVVTIN